MDGLLPSAWFLRISGFLFPGGANLLLHSTVIIATGLFASWLLKPKGAALQSLILRVALAGVLVSPIVTIAVSEIGIEGLTIPVSRKLFEPDVIERSFADTVAPNPRFSRDASVLWPVASDRDTEREPLAVIADRRGLGLPAMFRNVCRLTPCVIPCAVAAWFLLSLVLLVRFLFSVVRISRIRATAVSAGEDIAGKCAVLAEKMGVRIPAVLESPFVGSPFLTGIMRPAVLLPENCGRGDMIGDDVLLHELAHLSRGDCFWSMLGKIANIVIPFQPLLRRIRRKIDETSDLVCDDYVLKYSPDPHAYACRLFDIADRFHRSRTLYAPVANLVSFNSSLGRRIERILDTTRAISIGTGKRSVIRVGALCFLLTVLLGFTGFRTMRASEHVPDTSSSMTHIAAASIAVRLMSLQLVSDAGLQEVVLYSTLSDDRGDIGIDQPVKKAEADKTDNETAHPIKSGDARPSVATVSLIPVEHLESYPVTAERGNAASVSDLPIADRREEMPVSVAARVVTAPPSQAVTPSDAGNAPSLMEKPSQEQQAVVNVIEVPEAPHPVIPADRIECLRKGRKLMEIGDYAAAHELFLAALAKKSDDPETLCYLGKSSFGNRNNTEAILFFKNAVAHNPRYAEAHYLMGDVYLAMGNLDQAMKHHKTAIQLNSAYARKARSYY